MFILANITVSLIHSFVTIHHDIIMIIIIRGEGLCIVTNT